MQLPFYPQEKESGHQGFMSKTLFNVNKLGQSKTFAKHKSMSRDRTDIAAKSVKLAVRKVHKWL